MQEMQHPQLNPDLENKAAFVQRREYRAIGALAMATAAIGIGPKDLGRSQFGFGMGTVQSASAMAIGLNHYVNDSTVVTFRGAIGTSKAVSGASFGVVKGW
ncbi:TPA: YadA-like family protein [Pseudomonas aeruginosa]